MASLVSWLDLLVLTLALVFARTILDRRRRKGLPYPPGPRALPIVGNLLDIPKQYSWLRYTELSQKYGDIISFNVLGQTIVVLNSFHVCRDLLEKRSDIYSDRPAVPIVEMMGLSAFVPTSHFGDRWRQQRRLLDRGLRPSAAVKYRPMQQAKTRSLLSHLLTDPNHWGAYLERLQGELVLAMTYGYEVEGEDDRKVKVAQRFSEVGTATMLPGALLVNDLPFLQHIPEWLPWFSYKPVARLGNDLWQEAMRAPFQFVKESMMAGTALPSLALENLQEAEALDGAERELAEEMVTQTMGAMYSVGVESTATALTTFILAALLNPDVQKKARAEIDSVTARERLPTFEDRPKLPYIDAFCKEVLRWKQVTPLGVPHATLEDDVYEGFFIPKGSVVLANAWAILHNDAAYPDPDAFKPERFLNADQTLRDDPAVGAAFGFGKRVCPGRHFVDAALFIAVASVLAVFEIRREVDEQGNEVPFEVIYRDSVVCRPLPFPCSIIPRDDRAKALINKEANEGIF